MEQLNKDSIGRLAVAFLERDPTLVKTYGKDVFNHITSLLKNFTLRIRCDDRIKYSVGYQAALLTAINVGMRCYKGGVYVTLPPDAGKMVLRWPDDELYTAVTKLGGKIDQNIKCTCEILLGFSEEKESWRLAVDSWTAVVVPPGFQLPSSLGEDDFPLGGILGGAMAVGITFLNYAEFDESAGTAISGLSLWRPDISFNNPHARGPRPKIFPDKLWLLGLGHLGQAYTWTLGMIPYKEPEKLTVLLQDFDTVVAGNFDSGVLCNDQNIGTKKTRVTSEWLEARGVLTTIVERSFSSDFAFLQDDPRIMLAGVDSLDVRQSLPVDRFDLLLDVGLGAGLDFDLIRYNAFPNNGINPSILWPQQLTAPMKTPILHELSNSILGCGFTLGIASAFTGVISSCLVVSEVLRSCMQGPKVSQGYFSLRDLDIDGFKVVGNYGSELKSRFIQV
jgi:hypothetical protein